MEDKVFFTQTYDMGKGLGTLVATVYDGGLNAVFEWFGPRGGRRGFVVIPADMLAECVYAINNPHNISQPPNKSLHADGGNVTVFESGTIIEEIESD